MACSILTLCPAKRWCQEITAAVPVMLCSISAFRKYLGSDLRRSAKFQSEGDAGRKVGPSGLERLLVPVSRQDTAIICSFRCRCATFSITTIRARLSAISNHRFSGGPTSLTELALSEEQDSPNLPTIGDLSCKRGSLSRRRYWLTHAQLKASLLRVAFR